MIKTEIGEFGLSTCYDLRFPELYRKMAVMGAELFSWRPLGRSPGSKLGCC